MSKQLACGHTVYGNDGDELHELRVRLSVGEGARYSGTTRYLHLTMSVECGNAQSMSYSALEGFLVEASAASDWEPSGDSTYGWKYGIVTSKVVDLEQMEAAIPFLRKVKRGLARIADEAGSPTTFGAYCQRVAVALGAKKATIACKPENRHFGRDYIEVPIADIAYTMDSRRRDWREALAKEGIVPAGN